MEYGRKVARHSVTWGSLRLGREGREREGGGGDEPAITPGNGGKKLERQR